MADLSVIVPVYNNEAVLPQLHERLVTTLESLSLDFQLILVNDHSSDRSGEVIDQLAETDRRVLGLHLPANGGQNRAICRGMALNKADCVAVMDADLQDRPEHLGRLLSAYTAPGTAVFLRRTTRYQDRTRMLSSRAFKQILRLLTGLDAQAGSYFIIDKPLATVLAQQADRDPVATVLVALNAERIVYVDGERDESGGASSYSTLGRLAYALRAIRCAIGGRRLKSGM